MARRGYLSKLSVAVAVLSMIGCSDPPGDPILIIDLVGDNSNARDITGLGFSPDRIELIVSDTPTGTQRVVLVPDSTRKSLQLDFASSTIVSETITMFTPVHGYLHQIRFIEDSVAVSGPAAPGGAQAKVPSGPQTGIKVSPADGQPFELRRFSTTHIEARFDLKHQINRPTKTGFHFKPSIKATLLQDPAVSHVIPDQVVVRFKNGASAATIASVLHAFDPTTAITFTLEPSLNLHVITVPHSRALIDAVDYFQNHATVEYAMPRMVVPVGDNPRPAGSPNDPSFSASQPYLDQVSAPTAWDRQIGSMTVIVAVIDTGVDLKHPDIVNNLFLNEGEIPSDIRMAMTDVEPDGLITFRDLNHASNAGIVADSNGNMFIDGEDVLKPRAPGAIGGGLADAIDNDAISGESTNVVDDLVGARLGVFPAQKVCQPETCTPLVCEPDRCQDATGGPASGNCANGTCTGLCNPGPCTGGQCTPGPCTEGTPAKDNQVADDQPLRTNFEVEGHGTAVSGLIGAIGNNGRNMAGVAWNIRILPVKNCDSLGDCDIVSSYTQAMRYARRMGASVANLSLGGTQNVPGTTQAKVNRVVLTPLGKAYTDGLGSNAETTLMVVAAGNGINKMGQDCDAVSVVCAPAEVAMSHKLVVGAVDAADARASFSNFGASSVDVVAPGVGIFTLNRLQSTQSVDGTSFATPIVTGAAALMLAQKPSLSTDLATLRSTLVSSGTPITSATKLNVGACVNALSGP